MNSQEFFKLNTKRIETKNSSVQEQQDIEMIHLLISNISVNDVCGQIGYFPQLPTINSSVYYFISQGQTSMNQFLTILVKRMFHKPQTTVASSPFASFSYGNDESIMKFIIGNGLVFIDVKMHQSEFQCKHNVDVYNSFMPQFEHVILNMVYKLNPSFQQSKLVNLKAIIARHLDSIKRSSLHDRVNKTGQQMIQMIKHVLPRLKLRDSLALIFEFLFGDKTHESFVIFDYYQKIWCSIFTWEILKILLLEVSITEACKSIASIICEGNEIQKDVITPNMPVVNNAQESINLVFNIEHSNEIVATLHDIDIKCATQHEINFQVVKCDLPTIKGALCDIENGVLKIKNQNELFTPPFQTIQVAIINNQISSNVQVDDEITNLLRKIVALNIVDTCKSIEDLLILMSFADQLVFKIDNDDQINEFLNEVREFLGKNHVVIDGISLINKSNAQKIMLNSLIKFVHNKLLSNQLFVRLEVRWKGCMIAGAIDSWPIDIAKELYGSESKSLSISRSGSSLVTYVSINSLKRQLAKCACIGSSQTGLRKHARSDLEPSRCVLSLDERAIKIRKAYEDWNEIHKDFKFDANPANITIFSKFGSVLIDGNSTIPNYIFVAKTFEATQLIEEATKHVVDRFNINCTFNLSENFKYINFSDTSVDLVMKKEKAIFYDKITNYAVILGIKADDDVDEQESNFHHLSRMKFSQSINTKLTKEKTFECLGETFHVRFMYNDDFSEMQCFIPKSCVSYVYTTRNGAEYFQVIKKDGEIRYKQIQVVVTKIEDNLLYFHNGTRIDCYEACGDLVKISWMKELNKLNTTPAINKLIHEINKLIGSIKSGSLIELGAPVEVMSSNQVVPIIVNFKQMNSNSINKQYCDDCVSSFQPNVETTSKMQLFCDQENTIYCKDGKKVYILCSDKSIILNQKEVSQSDLINQMHQTVEKYKPIQPHLHKIKGQLMNLLYKQQLSSLRFDVTFIKTNQISMSEWYSPVLHLEEVNVNYPMIRLNIGQLAIGKIWTSSDLIEIKNKDEIKWEISNGKLIVPSVLKKRFPDLDLIDLCKSTDWFNKLHSLVERCVQQSLISKGHSCEIEFTTSSGNERDVLVDKEVIIEIKTQTLYNRAMQSFLENGKHIGEYLIAATRYSLFVSKFVVDKYYKDNAQDLQFICDVVCGYNKMRDENGKIMKNLFERMNFPQPVCSVNEMDTVISHDNLKEINIGIEPKYHSQLKDRFTHSKFERTFESLNTREECPFVKILANQEEFEKFTLLKKEFDEMCEKRSNIEKEIQELENQLMFYNDRFNAMDDLEEFMLTQEEQAIYDKVSVEIINKTQVLANTDDPFHAIQDKLNEFVQNKFELLVPKDQHEFEGEEFNVTLETNIMSHDNLCQTIEPRPVQLVDQRDDLNFKLTKFDVNHNFMKLSYDLTEFDGKFMKCKNNEKFNHPIELQFESKNFNIKIHIGDLFKKITIQNQHNNTTCLINEIPFKLGLFSDANQLNCMDVVVIMILMCIVGDKLKLVKPSWQGLKSIDCMSISKPELSECINYIWKNFNEFKQEFNEMKLQFVRAPDVFGVQLSMANLEHEVRSSIDELINAAINKWKVKHWKNQRLNYVKFVTQLLFLDELELNLRSTEFDNAYKIVKHVVGRYNTGSGTKLPEDVCFVQARCVDTDQPITTQNLIQQTLMKFNSASVDDLNQFNDNLQFEVSTFNVKFDFDQ